jgi:hypothetical protein
MSFFEWLNPARTIISYLILMERRIMATLDEFITQQTAFNEQLNTALTGITGDIQNLNDQIAVLQGTPGTLTPAQQAAIDALAATGAALATKAAGLDDLTPPVATP